jgi:hypothetical protein
MRRLINRRPTPAMAVAFLALFAALSGLAVAGPSIPGSGRVHSSDIHNNQVRSRDLRNNDVRTQDIRNGTVTGTDVADNSLTGADILESSLGTVPSATSANTANTANTATNAGNANTLGGIGPGGFVQPLFAVVEADGTLNRGSGVTSSTRTGTGNYVVDFGEDITGCAFLATLGVTGFAGTTSGVVDVAGAAGTTDSVFVDTEDPLGTQADRPFHLQVVC